MDLFVEGQILSVSSAVWLGFLIDFVVKGTLIIGGAWLVVRLLKRAPALVHSRIWTVAFVLLALCPVAWILSPGIGAPNLAAGLQLPTTAFSLIQVTEPGPLQTSSVTGIPDTTEREPVFHAATSDSDTATKKPAPSSRRLYVVRSFHLSAVVLVWLCVAAWMMLNTIRRLRVSRKISATARAVTSGRLVDTIRESESRLCIARPVEVHAGDGVSAPFVYGFFRQRLFLPEDARDWDEPGLRNVVLHELAHVRRRDLVRLVMIEFAKALYWFNPLVWWAARKAELSIEMACDDVVCDGGKGALDYARQLVRFAGQASGAVARAPGMAGKPGLEERVRNIIRPERGEVLTQPRRVVTVFPAGILVVVLLLPIAGLQTDMLSEGELSRVAPASTEQVPSTVASLLPRISIHEAAVAGDLHRVIESLAEDPSRLNSVDDRNMTPVALAAWNDRFEVVDHLINRGANLDLKNHNGLTPLFCALDRGRGDMARLFIKGGADPFVRGYRGRSLLHMAARTNLADIIRTLVSLGVDVNAPDRDGYTPLDVASWRPDPVIVDLLTRLGGVKSGIAPPPRSTPKLKNSFNTTRR